MTFLNDYVFPMVAGIMFQPFFKKYKAPVSVTSYVNNKRRGFS